MAVATLLVAAAAVLMLASTSATPARSGTTSPAAAPAPRTVDVPVGAPIVPAPVAAAGAAGGIVSGRHRVGTDVAPGVYDSAGPAVPGGVCSWSRRGPVPDGDVVLAAGTSREALSVTVRPGDAAFTTAGCAPWSPR